VSPAAADEVVHPTSATSTPASSTPLVTEISARRLGPVRRYFAVHPRAMDAVIMGLYGLPALVGTAIVTLARPGPVPLPPDGRAFLVGIALVVAGTVALNWRRARPVLVAAVMTVLDALAMVAVQTTLELGVAFGVYAVAACRPQRTTWVTFALTTATSLITSILVGVDSGVVFTSLLAVAIGISVRNRRLHVADLVERTNTLARERDQQARLARAAERSRIAREMHDVVAHNLAVMIALADGASAALDRSPDRTKGALGELSETGRGALTDMRRVLGVLHEPDATFEPPPSGTDLGGLVERFRAAGLPVRTTGLGVELPEDAGLQLTVFRIVSEALTNALRHAPGTERVDLELRRTSEAVEIEVEDLGPSLPEDPAPSGGQGLIGMAERAAVYGGAVEAGPSSRGWRVHAVLPWSAEDTP
jgi:signal transduction histidine kinase